MITKDDIIRRAMSAIGTGSWVSGAKPHMDDSPPLTTDCSGFTKWAFWPLLKLPDGSMNQIKVCKSITREQAHDLPGALCFGRNSNGEVNHVGLSNGMGMVIEAWISEGIVCKRSTSDARFTDFGDPFVKTDLPGPDPVVRPSHKGLHTQHRSSRK